MMRSAKACPGTSVAAPATNTSSKPCGPSSIAPERYRHENARHFRRTAADAKKYLRYRCRAKREDRAARLGLSVASQARERAFRFRLSPIRRGGCGSALGRDGEIDDAYRTGL